MYKALTYELRVNYYNGETEVAEWFSENEEAAAWDLYRDYCENPPYDAKRVELVHKRGTVASYDVE